MSQNPSIQRLSCSSTISASGTRRCFVILASSCLPQNEHRGFMPNSDFSNRTPYVRTHASAQGQSYSRSVLKKKWRKKERKPLTSISNQASIAYGYIRKTERTRIKHLGSAILRITICDHLTVSAKERNHNTRAQHKQSRPNNSILQPVVL